MFGAWRLVMLWVIATVVAVLAGAWYALWLLERRAEDAIMELLSDGRRWFGLDLVKQSGGRVKRGTVYGVLQRLELRGVISSEQARALNPWTGGIPQRLYWSPSAAKLRRSLGLQ
jgi:hypothetical protein